ncbi:transglycosylase family protein [Streptomyces clavuligerus]|uniref:Resuscitation-promoting factor RpfA n=7 Tax=Streptomyces clavuligerus TaxID=1901 RepID=E2Q7S1_STRCL|nr:transglycosylase family protein [Streptomyces clavuligerus]EFG09453.1 Resuscitation-promoting factor RpfA [Streptomyces clavuligerus]
MSATLGRLRIAGITVALAALAPFAAATAEAASVETWDKVAQCESGGNWSINTGNGYYGGLQFSLQTWRAYGGADYAAYPHQATKKQQILTAEKVLAGQGEGAWPTCGPRHGLGSDPAEPYPPTIPARDFTGDGRDDLLGISDAGELRLFETGADLSFATRVVGPGWAAKDLASAGDVNGDGRGDVVAVDRVTGDLHLWTGRGNGSLNAAVQVGRGWTNIEQLAVGDFTGDGKADVVAITRDTANLLLYPSSGSGFSGPVVLGTSGWGSVKNLAVGDFTGDGRADVVATNETSGQLSLYPSNGSGLNGSAVIGSSFHLKDKLTMADLNKDGTSDIVAVDRATGDLTIYASNGSAITDTRKIGDGWSTMTNLL